MTIDEIIENEKEIADMLYDQQRSHSAYYHKQLAELLEELKFRRVLQLQCEKEFFAGYENGTIRPMWLEKIAEKLKAGITND